MQHSGSSSTDSASPGGARPTPVLEFESGEPATVNISRPIDAVSCNDTAYFRGYRSRVIYAYNASTLSWFKLPECPVKDTSLATLNDIETNTPTLHTLGGLLVQEGSTEAPLVGDLYCLRQHPSTNKYYWAQSPLPPMTKKRKQVTAIRCSNYLFAAGGRGEKGPSRTVEILSLTTKQWSIVASLPIAVFRASGCVSGDSLYILGGCVHDKDSNIKDVKYAFKTLLSQLIEPHEGDSSTFKAIAELPFLRSTCTTFRDRIFAVGGSKYNKIAGEAKCSNLIHIYHQEDDSWKRIDRTLTQPRCYCFAVSLAHQLIVAGGYTGKPDEGCTNSVEIADFSDEAQSAKNEYDMAMKEGCVTMKISHVLLLGASGVGKTTIKHTIILSKDPPQARSSTPLADSVARIHIPVQNVETEKIKFAKCESKWSQINSDSFREMIADTIIDFFKSIADKLRTKEDSVSQVVKDHSLTASEDQSDDPKTDSHSAVEPSAIQLSEPLQSAARSDLEGQREFTINQLKTTITKVRSEILKMVSTRQNMGRPDQLELLQTHWVYLTDSGGHPFFYNLLPHFTHGIHVAIHVHRLCDSLAKRPSAVYFKDGNSRGHPYESPLTTKDTFHHLIRSILSHSVNKAFRLVCIGTHFDIIREHRETVKQMNEEFLKIIPEEMREKCLSSNSPIFPVDAREKNPNLTKQLYKYFQKVYKEVEVPVWWYILEVIINKFSTDQNRKVLLKRECIDIAELINISEEKLVEALKWFHSNHIFHYYAKFLPNVVFCDTQVLLSIISELVIEAHFLRSDCAHPAVDGKWGKFGERGILTLEILEHFKEFYVQGIFESKDLISILEYHLIVTPLTCDESSKNEYFMPSALEYLSSFDLEKYRNFDTKAAPVVIKFENSWPQCGLFCCVQVYLMNKREWKLCRHDKPKQNCVKFSLPNEPFCVTLIDSFSYFEVYARADKSNKSRELPESIKLYQRVCPEIIKEIQTAIEESCTVLRCTNQQPVTAFFCPHKHSLCTEWCEYILFKMGMATPDRHIATPYKSSDSNSMKCEQEDGFSPQLDASHNVWLTKYPVTDQPTTEPKQQSTCEQRSDKERTVTLETLTEGFNITSDQLNTEIEDDDPSYVSPYFGDPEQYMGVFGLTPAEQTDVKKCSGCQTAIAMCLSLWRKHNPSTATFKNLLEILLNLRKEEVAKKVLERHLSKIKERQKSIDVSYTPGNLSSSVDTLRQRRK